MSALTWPTVRPDFTSTPAYTAWRRCRSWRLMTSGLVTGSIVGDALQRHRRAVGGEGDRQLVQLRDALAAGLRQAQLHLDLLAVGRRPVGRHVALHVGAQAAGQLLRRHAQLARGVGPHAHRVRGQAGLDRGLEVGEALDLLHLRAEVGGDLVEHGRIRAQDRDEDRPVAERDGDARQAFEALADLVLDLELGELALRGAASGTMPM